MIICKIDVTKIEKARLFEGKNGAKYLDICIMENRDGTDKYGNDFMVVQSVSKEEREAGKRGPILGNGNGKTVGSRPRPSQEKQKPPPEPTSSGDDDDIPF